MFCALYFSAAELMSFGHLGTAIWHRSTIICGVPSKISVTTIDILKNNIPEAIGEYCMHPIDNVLKNWTDRVGYCMASQDNHLNEIIFALLTGRIVLSNKKGHFIKYSVVFLKHFPKKNRYLVSYVRSFAIGWSIFYFLWFTHLVKEIYWIFSKL